MKGLRFIKQLSDVMFWASAVGMVFSGIMMFTTNRPFMSFGLLLLCIGMALMCANVQVWAEGKLKERSNKNGEQHKSYHKTA